MLIFTLHHSIHDKYNDSVICFALIEVIPCR